MKKVISFMLAVLMLVSFVGCAKKQHEYNEGSWLTIRDDIETNLANAKEKYIGEYYSFTGEAKYITEKDSFFVYEVNPGMYYLYGICCFVKDKELQETVLSLKEGDIVTIKGKITAIDKYNPMDGNGKISMNIYEITIK